MTPEPLTTSLRNWLSGNPDRPAIPDECAPFLRVHRVLGLLYHIEANLGESLRSEARSNWEKNAHAYLKRVTALKKIWPQTDHPPLIIKGADYNEHVYRDPGARVSYDLDCLMHSSDIQTVLTATQPWHRQVTVGDHDHLGTHWDVLVDDVLLEFHSVPAPRFPWSLDMETMWHTSIPVTIDDFSCRVPEPRQRLFIYLVNQAKTAFTDGLWSVVDLAMILKDLRARGMDWAELKEQTADMGLNHVYGLALARLDSAQLMSGLPDDARRPLYRHLLKWIPAEAPSDLGHPLRRQALKLCLCQTRAKIPFLMSSMKRYLLQGDVD